MPFIPTPEVSKHAVVQTLYGVEVVNVLHWWHNEPITNPMMVQAVNEYLGDFFGLVVKTFQAPELRYDRIEGRSIENPEDYEATYNFPAGVVGTDTTPAAPGSVALVVSLRTGITGRSARGRLYLAGLSESDITGNIYNDTQRVAIQDAFTSLVDRSYGTPPLGGLCVVSFWDDGVQRTEGRPLAYTSCIVNAGLDSQRRRLT